MKKVLMALLTTLVIFLLSGEIISRHTYSQRTHLPFFYATEELIYPELFYIKKKYNHHKPNVLLIGGSTLQFAARDGVFEKVSQDHFNFYDAAMKAHTSLDNLYKYAYLIGRGYHFDYVVFYNNINDVRANNVPPEYFSENYNHYFFYRSVNSVLKNPNRLWGFLTRYSALAYRLNQFYLKLTTQHSKLLGLHSPPKEWLKYGGNIKTEKTFRQNLLGMLELARREKSNLIVPVFAVHPVASYSLKKFKAHRLGYRREKGFPDYPDDLWGQEENVLKGIAVHNNVIRSLKDYFYLIDTTSLSKDLTNFDDLCHFSTKGKIEFATLIIDKIREIQTRTKILAE